MMLLNPPKSRYTVEDTFAALRITIPARRSWAIILLSGLWLMGWAAAEIFVGIMLIRILIALLAGKPEVAGDAGGSIGGVFMTVWFTLWTVGGGAVSAQWAWNVAGKETVFIDGESLTIKKSVFGIGRSRRYSTAYVDRLRASGDRDVSQGPWGGGLAFDHVGRAVNFGAGLSQTDATELAAQIGSRFPALAKGVE
jgi:hypothetical protein